MKLESIAVTHQGLVREMNQDSILAMDRQASYLVADGMGGEKAGEEASAQVVSTVEEAVKSFFGEAPEGPSQIESMLRETLMQANHDVYQISVEEPTKRGLGSTASLLCLHRGVYFCGQVGDSRIYLARNGNVHQITRDHTLVWTLYEQGHINRAQLETHPERHLLTQCIGNERPIKVDTFEGSVQAGDVFLICSDGLTGYAGEDEVFRILTNRSLSLKKRADKLIQAALDAGGGDNVSVILVKVLELEEDDDWTPEATAEPQPFDPAAADTLIDEEARPRKIRRGPHPGVIATVAVLAVVLAALIFMLMREPQAKLYFSTPSENTTVLVETEEGVISPTIRHDAGGAYVTVDAEGIYTLTIAPEGYVAREIKLTVDPQNPVMDLETHQWEELAHLRLDWSGVERPGRIWLERLSAEGTGSEEEIARTADQLGDADSIVLHIQPGEFYRAYAQTEDGRLFTSRRQKLRPAQEKTIAITYEEGAAGAP